jgi:hypothetical protein
MKKLLSFSLPLLAMAIVLAGCPTGIEYPLGTPGSEKIDERLLGTWYTDKDDPEFQSLRIEKRDDYSYKIEVFDTGTMYEPEGTSFYGWVTKLGGRDFIFAKPIGGAEYFTYCYMIDGAKQMRSYDVGLLVGGTDAVSSTASYRKEVEASLKMDDCLSDETLWTKE